MTVFKGPLRRAYVSFGAMWVGESAFAVALAIVAFHDGGVTAVGIVTTVRMATAALLTPFLATLADRVRRERVLVTIGVVRRRCWDSPVITCTSNGFRPARS